MSHRQRCEQLSQRKRSGGATFQGTLLLAAIALGVAESPSVWGQIVNNYDVRRTTTAPTIDGVISMREWDRATPVEGTWGVLGERQPPADLDTENNRFRMLWDDAALYVLYETSFNNFLEPLNSGNPSMNFNEDNLNLYFDPNTDDEANFVNNPESNVDGYQFAFNQYRRLDGAPLISTHASRQGVGVFTEAHVNASSGNQGQWGGANVNTFLGPAMGSIVIAQNYSANSTEGGVAELIFPWAAFNAPAQIPGSGQQMIATGLNHTAAPVVGDEWFFNMLRINRNPSGGNFRPIWNWHAGLFGSLHPHGTLTFREALPAPGDFDADGDVDGDDLGAWNEAFGVELTGEDFLVWQQNFDGSAADGFQAIPEPSAALLGWAAALGVVGRRRLRRPACLGAPH